jgi:hypothetical protein
MQFPPALKVHREPRAVAIKLDNSKSVGTATKGDLSGQFSSFRHCASPVKRLNIVTIALENHLAALHVSLEMLAG